MVSYNCWVLKTPIVQIPCVLPPYITLLLLISLFIFYLIHFRNIFIFYYKAHLFKFLLSFITGNMHIYFFKPFFTVDVLISSWHFFSTLRTRVFDHSSSIFDMALVDATRWHYDQMQLRFPFCSPYYCFHTAELCFRNWKELSLDMHRKLFQKVSDE